MSSFIQLPSWLPWWAPLAGLVPLALYGILFLAMPFSVFGVKARLEAMEARLDEIQGEIRSLSVRLPEPGSFAPGVSVERPPIPPARNTNETDRVRQVESGKSPPPARGARSEPRLDWPR